MIFSACRTPFLIWLACSLPGIAGEKKFQSHPPLRPLPTPSDRPVARSGSFYIDPIKGDDEKNAGTKGEPWRSLSYGLTRVRTGEQLILRGGIYYENVAIRVHGEKDQPIVIRSHPGETAIIDGSIREFFEAPERAWSSLRGDEYISRRPHANLRNVVGAFGDSMVGLHTYYHEKDLLAEREHIEADEQDIKPLWCGPGLWYDRYDGRIHVRLAHTTLFPSDNYRGETDPRKIRLVIAPLHSLPLHLDSAENIILQDLVIRGGGYHTVLLDQCKDLTFDNVTIYAGTFGMKVVGTQRLRFLNSGIHGSVPPWCTRFDTSLKARPWAATRDITRLNTHALLVADANKEYSVYAYPFNDDWEIANSEFTDSHDGVYLGGVNMKFHHNVLDNCQDDGVYLSPMYPRHIYLKGGATIEMYQNVLSRCLTMLAFGGDEDTRDTIYFYRNIVDLRGDIRLGRPKAPADKMIAGSGKVTGDHGSPPWPSMMTYHNTFIIRGAAREPDAWMGRGSKDHPRRVFNNIFLHLESLPALIAPDPALAHTDGNLFWQPGLDAKKAKDYFTAYRKSVAFAKSEEVYEGGFHARSVVADPKFRKIEADPVVVNDYRLQPGSAAIDIGVKLPDKWPDVRDLVDSRAPDAGALPFSEEMWKVGRPRK